LEPDCRLVTQAGRASDRGVIPRDALGDPGGAWLVDGPVERVPTGVEYAWVFKGTRLLVATVIENLGRGIIGATR